MALNLSFSCSRYDRVAPVTSGEIPIEGVDLIYLPLEPEEGFWRHTQHAEFDLAEMSLSGHIHRVATGDDRFIGLPIFPSRAFRHANIVVRKDLDLSDPSYLKGKSLGVPEYHMTAALYMKGLLADEYGVTASDVQWVQAGQFAPGRVERERLDLPPNISLRVDREKTIEQMLRSGELDGATTPYVPLLLGEPDSPIKRLYDDPKAAITDYYRRTGIFPIMHLIVLRRSLYEQHPWLARSIMKAFEAARSLAMARLPGLGGHSPTMLPLFQDYIGETRQIFGDDWWPYGIRSNAATLDAAVRYSYDQGISHRLVGVEELFAPEALDETVVESDSRRTRPPAP